MTTAAKASNWLEVDRAGLAQLVERRGKAYIVFEPAQNAWDETVTHVRITLTPVAGKPLAQLNVEDDSPDGFRDLRHAYTLFAPSYKKDDDSKRGRFNLGEKLLLAICETASVISTTGGVTFDAEGRTNIRAKTAKGTRLSATVRMTREELEDVCTQAQRMIPPVPTYFNGELIKARSCVGVAKGRLMTEMSNAEGIMRRGYRDAEVHVYEPPDGQPGWLLEMGIPICETGDRYDYNVMNRVPLGMERDSVPESFLRDVRAIALNAAATWLTDEEAAAPWVGDALADEQVEPATVRSIVTSRFGDKRVSFDPSDPEANARAASQGYTVVHGGSFSKDQWDNIRRAEAILPAGKVTPTPKPFAADGQPLKYLDGEKWTPAHRAVVDFVQWLADKTIFAGIDVSIADDPGWRGTNGGPLIHACYGSKTLTFNQGALGEAWFTDPDAEKIIDLTIHELGHEYASNHLSEGYYRALSAIGSRAAIALAENPEKLNLLRPGAVA